jgi:hypothetical protein
MVVTTLTQLKRQVRWPYQHLCRFLGVPYGTFRRWKARLAHGEPARFQPGPKKVAPLSREELRGEVQHLHHGQERSRGTGALYRRHHTQVSRRELAALIEAVRREVAEQRRAALRHVTWHVPGAVWSLDDAELVRGDSPLLRLHQVQDLASRYKFPPWVGERILGATVAQRLEALFRQYGPPLVMKRDNGGNLNQQAVEEVLARYLVMPLNSPPHYPPYNGGMEHAVGELKGPLVAQLLAGGPIPPAEVQKWAELLAHELNHRPRPSLQGAVACTVFQEARAALKSYTLRKRREFFEEVNDLTQMLMQAQGGCTQRQADTVRRLAVEAWLQKEGVISISQNHRVSPIFPEKIAHNY